MRRPATRRDGTPPATPRAARRAPWRRKREGAGLLGVAPLVLLLLVPSSLRAEGDGLYGRFDTDLRLAGNVGGDFTPSSNPSDVALHVSARMRLLYAAGLGIGTSLGPRGGEGFAGLELRPLFPALFLMDAFSGDAWMDLTIQSLGLEVGLWTPIEGFGARWSPYAALSLESPLRPPNRRGPSLWARLEARWLALSDADRRRRRAWRVLLSLSMDVRLPGHPISSWEPH